MLSDFLPSQSCPFAFLARCNQAFIYCPNSLNHEPLAFEWGRVSDSWLEKQQGTEVATLEQVDQPARYLEELVIRLFYVF